ncbi:MAG: dihydropteroate synthase, partial [Planctomycetota bacterium]
MDGAPRADARAPWLIAPGLALGAERTALMGVVNATPDSFSDAGHNLDPEAALATARAMIARGADLLDVGGESTRPGADRVRAEEQISRVVPVISAIRAAGIDTPISIDSTIPAVAEAALEAGANAINDVSGASEHPEILALAAERGCGIALMHRLRPPGEDSYSDRYRHAPEYADVAAHVRDALESMASRALDAGCAPASICLDPGLGFGKSVEQNTELVRRLGEIASLGFAVLAGASRKSFVGRLS